MKSYSYSRTKIEAVHNGLTLTCGIWADFEDSILLVVEADDLDTRGLRKANLRLLLMIR